MIGPVEPKVALTDNGQQHVHEMRVSRMLQDALDKIEEFGWMVIGVGAGDDQPSFTYSVGFSRFDHPEVIVFALPPDVAQHYLNRMGARIKDGRRYRAGELVEFTEDTEITFCLIPVADSSKHLTVSNRLFAQDHDHPLTALQLVWPDVGGQWPWQEGYSTGQVPLLGEVPESLK